MHYNIIEIRWAYSRKDGTDALMLAIQSRRGVGLLLCGYELQPFRGTSVSSSFSQEVRRHTHLTSSLFIAQQATTNDQSFLHIMRASHVIKGASSNLMCQQLREGATNLEQAAAGANEISRDDESALEAATEQVKEKYAELKKAVDEYHAFLKKVGV